MTEQLREEIKRNVSKFGDALQRGKLWALNGVGRNVTILLILNLIDAFSTWFLVKMGYAYEVNPFMRYLLEEGPVPFFGIKIALISLCCMGLYWGRREIFAKWGAVVAVLFYMLAILSHVIVLGHVAVYYY